MPVVSDVAAPTGTQVRLTHGTQEVWAVAVAAGLRSYLVDGRPVVDGFEADQRPNGGRGQTLAPWPNRIADGSYSLDGSAQQVALSEPLQRNAIHGLARWVVWDVASQLDTSVTFEHVVVPQPGWPTSLLLQVTYALSDDGLTVITTASNDGAAACLYGTGSHPYLRLGPDTVDALTVQVPASRWLEVDQRGIPVAEHDVEGTEYDLRAPAVIGERRLDTAYGDVARDPDGRWRVRVEDGEHAVTLWADAAYGWLQLFTGDTLPAPFARRGLAVEPTTCPPNAFNAPDPAAVGVVRLEPGQSHTAIWGITPG
jgi:aldose 1-epimerase